MKNIIAIMTLFIITFFNLAVAVTDAEIVTPAPEVIACESQGTCEMTTLEFLLQAEQKGLVETKQTHTPQGKIVVK